MLSGVPIHVFFTVIGQSGAGHPPRSGLVLLPLPEVRGTRSCHAQVPEQAWQGNSLSGRDLGMALSPASLRPWLYGVLVLVRARGDQCGLCQDPFAPLAEDLHASRRGPLNTWYRRTWKFAVFRRCHCHCFNLIVKWDGSILQGSLPSSRYTIHHNFGASTIFHRNLKIFLKLIWLWFLFFIYCYTT